MKRVIFTVLCLSQSYVLPTFACEPEQTQETIQKEIEDHTPRLPHGRTQNLYLSTDIVGVLTVDRLILHINEKNNLESFQMGEQIYRIKELLTYTKDEPLTLFPVTYYFSTKDVLHLSLDDFSKSEGGIIRFNFLRNFISNERQTIHFRLKKKEDKWVFTKEKQPFNQLHFNEAISWGKTVGISQLEFRSIPEVLNQNEEHPDDESQEEV